MVLGSFLSMTAGFGTVNTIGIFEAHISQNQLAGRSGSDVSWIFGIFVFLVFFCGLQIGPVFDVKGPRGLVGVGGVCLVGSLMALGVCTGEFFLL